MMPATNPLLDEINGLSPGAKVALAQAHAATQAPKIQPQQPMGGAPPNVEMQAPSQMPAVPQMGQQPHVSLAPQPKGTLMGDQAAMQEMAAKKAPLESVYSGITHSGFGQNHPVLGKVLGALGQIPATAADVVASGVAPRLGALIPGTSVNRGLQLKGLENRIGQEEKNRTEEAQAREMNSRAPLEEAQAQHYGDQLQLQRDQLNGQLAEHGLGIDENGKLGPVKDEQLSPELRSKLQGQWKPVPGVAGPNGEPMEYNENAGTYRVAPGSQGASLVSTDKTTGGTKGALQEQLVAAQNVGDTKTAKKLQQQIKDIDPLGENRIAVSIQGQQNAQNARLDAKTQKEYDYTRNKWDKELGTYESQANKLAEASQLVGSGAMGSALGSIKALSGLAGGQGSGVRITQAELNSIAHARGFKGDFDAFLQQFGDGNKLTPQQIGALKNIIADVQHVAQLKESIINRGRDDLNEATDTQTIRKIDSQLRHALMGGQ